MWLSSLLLFVAFSASVKPSNAFLTDVSNEGACYNFSVGNPEKKEFFSPNYPNEYPTNIQCTIRIVADAGYVVKLDFKDQFHLENSAQCEHDKLDVRDGAYGYSRLLGTFCGYDIPSTLISSGRYMWLRFTSDDLVVNTGFKAEYTFIRKPRLR